VIPTLLTQVFPNLFALISHVTIPLNPVEDKLLWKHTDSGDLQLKDAFLFKVQQHQDLPWANFIWCVDIPPSKSLFVWRLMHEKIPTDENLMARGCCIPSICNLCNKHVESSFHTFFECDFASKLWSWLAGCLDQVMQFTTMDDMWKLCELNWFPQVKVTVLAAIVNLLNTIWFARNQSKFHNKTISWRAAISLIISNTAISGNNTSKLSSNSMRDFTFLKLFSITIHHPRIPIIREIIWQPPLGNWTKCNTHDASCGNPGNASCGGVFRDDKADFLFAFAEPLGFESSFFAELCGALRAIEIAFDRNWLNLWLESDSSLVVAAFKNPNKPIAWPLRNRWNNVLLKTSQMNFIVTHVYREGNKVADLVANFGLNVPAFTSWSTAPDFILESLACNKLGIPNFRFCVS
jgi:ribonuclease HI